MLLVVGIDADEFRQPDDPRDPLLFDLVKAVERRVLDGGGPEVQFRADDVVNRPLLDHDLIPDFRGKLGLLPAIRIEVLDLQECPVHTGHVSLDAQLQR